MAWVANYRVRVRGGDHGSTDVACTADSFL